MSKTIYELSLDEIRAACKRDGIGAMEGIFEVILDRNEVSAEELAAFLSSRNVFELYEGFIVNGIDRLSDHIQEVMGDV